MIEILSDLENKKKNRRIFHPIFVAIFPILIIYSQNVGRVNVEDLILPIVLVSLFSVSVYYILKFILKNPFKAALIVTIILILVFAYGHVYYLLNDVSIDEFESGTDRIKLNFGHTIGHALETATSYNSLLHGEAVSIGMVVASKISSALSYSDDNLTNEIQNILDVYNLPTRIPKNIDLDDLYTIAKSDKKVRAGKINWVLLKKIGESVIVNDVPKEIVIDSLRSSQ